MNKQPRALFLDIGGVLLNNGWDTDTRKAAAEFFQLDYKDMDSRHRMTFDTYEIGKLSMSEYLKRVVFYKERGFTEADFIEWIRSHWKADQPMLDYMKRLKDKYKLKIGVISNEGREIAEYRIVKFGLLDFVDFFVCSAFVHLRKPDTDIYRIALDLIQIPANEVVYLEDRPLFVEVAGQRGIQAILHKNYEETRAAFKALGLDA